MNARFCIVVAFARHCILCTRCDRFLTGVGRAPCKRTLKNAKELQRLQDAAEPVSAQPADRELDPEADAPARVSCLDDEDRDITMFLADQRRAEEDRAIAARAAAATRREVQRRQARSFARQQPLPAA